jgi:hypothetical protein
MTTKEGLLNDGNGGITLSQTTAHRNDGRGEIASFLTLTAERNTMLWQKLILCGLAPRRNTIAGRQGNKGKF